MAKFDGEALGPKWEVDCSPPRQIGRGTSTKVYLGINRNTAQLVAVKMGMANRAPQAERCTIPHEYQVYEMLRGGRQLPIIYDFLTKKVQRGRKLMYQHFLIMEQLGPSLHKTMQSRLARPRLASSGLFFSREEVARIGAEIVSALAFVHGRHLIHQDIRPGHIVYDLSLRKVKLIGFGNARSYRHSTTLQHFPEMTPGPIGSPIYTSVNGHHGRTLSRRDDLESLAYVLIYLSRGSLPWKDFPRMSGSEILAKKTSVAVEVLCGGLEPLSSYLYSVKSLAFDQSPDYDTLHQMLTTLSTWG